MRVMSMSRYSSLALALLCVASVAEAARTCDVPAPGFATGCYRGDGVSGRTIITNLARPGLLIVSHKANFPDVSQWHTPEMPAGTSCAMANGAPQCPTDAILSVNDCGFQVGTRLNSNTQPYCWYEAQIDPAHHGTVQWLGDGNSPRTIAMPFTPEFCALQLASNNTVNFANVFYTRTEAMPANTNYCLDSTNVPSATYISSLTTNGFVVAAAANELNKTYRAFCFRGGAGYGEVLHWVGNGASFGGDCANAADTQSINVSAGGAVQWLVATGCAIGAAACDRATCTLHAGASDGWRGINIGTDVVGPGNIVGSDFYQQECKQPDSSQIGGLSDHDQTFIVRGSGTNGGSLNDLNGNYYAFVITAPTPGSSTACPTPTP
jgi:hypothetical protein